MGRRHLGNNINIQWMTSLWCQNWFTKILPWEEVGKYHDIRFNTPLYIFHDTNGMTTNNIIFIVNVVLNCALNINRTKFLVNDKTLHLSHSLPLYRSLFLHYQHYLHLYGSMPHSIFLCAHYILRGLISRIYYSRLYPTPYQSCPIDKPKARQSYLLHI